MRPRALAASLFLTACFREAPPCDQATLERIKSTCQTVDECDRQLDEREAVCVERARSE